MAAAAAANRWIRLTVDSRRLQCIDKVMCRSKWPEYALQNSQVPPDVVLDAPGARRRCSNALVACWARTHVVGAARQLEAWWAAVGSGRLEAGCWHEHDGHACSPSHLNSRPIVNSAYYTHSTAHALASPDTPHASACALRACVSQARHNRNLRACSSNVGPRHTSDAHKN